MSFLLAILDLVTAIEEEVRLPTFSPMYIYLLSWGFALSIIFFLGVLVILAIKGQL
jgi:hypothetical protein